MNTEGELCTEQVASKQAFMLENKGGGAGSGAMGGP